MSKGIRLLIISGLFVLTVTRHAPADIRVGVYNADLAPNVFTEKGTNLLIGKCGPNNPQRLTIGDKGITKAVDGQDDMAVKEIGSMDLATLLEFDVVIMPNCFTMGLYRSPFNTSDTGKKLLHALRHDARAYVQTGGGLLLIGHHTGLDWGYT
ncbi:hypothetical protein ACFLQR_03690, partial [Verrucomicrobiota bacterium]